MYRKREEVPGLQCGSFGNEQIGGMRILGGGRECNPNREDKRLAALKVSEASTDVKTLFRYVLDHLCMFISTNSYLLPTSRYRKGETESVSFDL